MFDRYENQFGRYDLVLPAKMVGMAKNVSDTLYDSENFRWSSVLFMHGLIQEFKLVFTFISVYYCTICLYS